MVLLLAVKAGSFFLLVGPKFPRVRNMCEIGGLFPAVSHNAVSGTIK